MKGDRLILGLLIGFVSLLGWSEEAIAQSVIVPDETLGNQNSALPPALQSPGLDIITGGATRGNNLFHSFREFNVGQGQSTYFFLPDVAIKNILTRITGNNHSEFLGRLGTLQASGNTFAPSDANFFFMNPNGIIFGPSSSLDIGGSVLITTANAFQFPGGELFSSSNPTIPSQVLTINPSALLYNAIVAQNSGIVVRSSLNDPNNLIGLTNGLQLRNSKSLLLIGGNLNLEGAALNVPEGLIKMSGLSESGEIELIVDKGNIDFLNPINQSKADITLSNNSRINVASTTGNNGGGSISIYAGNFSLLNSDLVSGINADTISRNSQSGDIVINALGNVSLGLSAIKNAVRANNFNNIEANTGNIIIKGTNIKIDSSDVSTLIDVGNGNSGNISLLTSGDLSINNSGISGSIPNLTGGNAGSLFVRSKNLTVTASSFSSGSSSFSGDGKGNAGHIDIFIDNNAIFTRGPITLVEDDSGNLVPIYDESSLRSGTGFGSAGQGGNIIIKSNYLKIEGTTIDSSTRTGGVAGNITLESRGRTDISRAIIDSSNSNGQYIGGIAGNTTIKSDHINIGDKTEILAGNIGKDDKVITSGGIIILNANKSIVIDFSRVQSEARASGGLNEDQAGQILLSAPLILITNSSEINTKTEANSRAGNISINSDKLIVTLSSVVGSFVERETKDGSGGTININTRDLELTNGGKLTSSVLGDTQLTSRFGYVRSLTGSQGNGGSIRVNVQDDITITGVSLTNKTLRDDNSLSPRGSASGIFTTIESGASGNAGSITVKGGNLYLYDGGQIASQNLGTGNSGDIDLRVNNIFEAKNGSVLANSNQATGGNISIVSGRILLKSNSDIRTNAINNGGNISLTANSIVALNDSDILAFARDGKGGNITLNTKAFFGQNYRPAPPGTDPRTLDGNDRVDINASGTISGIITLPDVSFIQNSLNQLPKSAIDTEKLVSQTCIVRQNQPTGTFYIIGKTNLPQRPSDRIPSNYSTQETQTQTANKPWQKGDPIVEPTGFYKLANGRLVMSRECDR